MTPRSTLAVTTRQQLTERIVLRCAEELADILANECFAP